MKDALNAREVALLSALAVGVTPTQLAAELGVSRQAVYNSQSRIAGKLGVRNIRAAIALAVAANIISIDPKD